MNKIIFGFSLAAMAAAMAASAAAADFEPPPPVTDLRPAAYDWSGPYIGLKLSGITETGSYTTNCAACGTSVRDMNGHGWAGGVEAGWNYQMDNFVIGFEGDWSFGGHVARNHAPTEMTDLKFRNIATVRARAGMAFDDTLVYATGGAAFVDTAFSTSDFPTGSGLGANSKKWAKGFVVGGGIAHAFTDRISGKLEYTYMGLADQTYHLDNGAGNVVDVEHDFEGIHTVSVGLDYNFSW